MSEVSKDCTERCPKYLLCEKMVKTGLSHLLLADSATSMVEYEAEDGRLISSAEFWGTADMSSEQLELHRQAGESLCEGGKLLQQQLLAGCTEGPLELSDGVVMCQSANRNKVFFTEEDLE